MKIVKLRNKNNEEIIPESINKLINYSFDETVIGTWFGKPLYRRVIDGTITGSGYWENFPTVIGTNLHIKKMDAMMNGYLALPVDLQNEYRIALQYNATDGGHIQALMNGFENQFIIVILEYTKTTD